MRILLITNILTPYRAYFYDSLYSKLSDRNGDFKVAVLSESEPNRNWSYNHFKRIYTDLIDSYSIYINGNIYIHIPKNIKNIILNFKPDKVIVGGSYLNPSIITLKKISKTMNYDLLFWSESHLNEDKGYGSFKKTIRDYVRKKMISQFNIFCVPGELAKDFIRKNTNECEFYSLPNLVDSAIYIKAYNNREANKNILKEKYNVNKEKYVFFLPARLAPVKGILEFLNLYKETEYKHKATVLIAGTGMLRDEINDYCMYNKLDVRLIGDKTQEEMVELYTIANSLLLPSLSDPNPLSCVEALWAGLPLLVSTGVGNYPEVVAQNENGFVFSYSDKQDSIEKIDYMISKDKHWNNNASIKSIEIAKNRFCTESVINELLDEL